MALMLDAVKFLMLGPVGRILYLVLEIYYVFRSI